MLLLVEDELLVAMPVTLALSDEGHEVLQACSGEEAVALLQERHHQIIGLISDVRLGGAVTGWDVARRARELNPELPVIYVSGDSWKEWTVNGVPGSVMVEKPFTLADIVSAMANLIGGEHVRARVATG